MLAKPTLFLLLLAATSSVFAQTYSSVSDESSNSNELRGRCVQPNEVWNECGSGCGERTCLDPPTTEPPICPAVCRPGCYCKDGFTRQSPGGICVRRCMTPVPLPDSRTKRQMLPPPQQCMEHASPSNCVSSCEPQCGKPKNRICDMMCRTGCKCDEGYKLNVKGDKCVKKCNEKYDDGMQESRNKRESPPLPSIVPVPSGPITCATLDCAPGHTCTQTAQGAQCVPIDSTIHPAPGQVTCASTLCINGRRCIDTAQGPRCVPMNGTSTQSPIGTVSPGQCMENAEWSDCVSLCEPQCGKPQNVPCPLMCKVGCKCSSGFKLSKDGSKCVKSCDSDDNGQCTKPNEQWNECGSGCGERTCANRPPKGPMMCPAVCRPGCYCRPGWIRLAPGGPCVRNCNRPFPLTAATATPLSSRSKRQADSNSDSLMQPPRRITCANVRCAGRCIDTPQGPRCVGNDNPGDSNSSHQCMENAIWSDCKSACEPQCGKPQNQPCIEICLSGCKCKNHFILSADGKRCVKSCDEDSASSMRPRIPEGTPPEIPASSSKRSLGCETVKCSAGFWCEMIDQTSGNQLPMCIRKNPCASTSCPVGTECRLLQVQCIRAPCDPIAQCVEPKDGDTSGERRCGKYEEWRECANNCTEHKCGTSTEQFCTRECLFSACQCRDGFYRNSVGACVPLSECEQQETYDDGYRPNDNGYYNKPY